MRKKIKQTVITAFLLLFSVCFIFAEKTPIQNLYQYTLKNGLELYVAENHSVPLVSIKIAVKAGGIAQTPENAGLFHLYEHMMFKGNTKYKSAADVQAAIKSMGVTTWNGSTGDETVQYFFTIPVSQLQKGLEFWSYAIRDPLLDGKELADEKKVVLSEIEGGYSEPNQILSSGMMKALFPSAPWKLDPAGPADNVKKATIDDLKAIKNKYYVPNNAALFVGGDVKPEAVYKLVKKIYGTWQRAPDPWTVQNNQQLMEPYTETQYYVMPYDKMSTQMSEVIVSYRGPDAEFNIDDTYAADVTGYLMEDPSGSYKQIMCSKQQLMIPTSDYLNEGYLTKRESGRIQFSAVLLSPVNNLTGRVQLFLYTLQNEVLPKYTEANAFSDNQLAQVYQKLEDNRIMEEETSSGLLDTLQFWWTAADANYYYNYNINMKKTGNTEIASFINKYITGKKPVVLVLVNPSVYEKEKNDFDSKGYTEITKANAFWWGDKK